jgi:hypothetical protein
MYDVPSKLSLARKLFFFRLILLLSIYKGMAQGNSPAAARQWYDRETIYMLSPTRYVRNNVVYAGASNLQREFSISPAGMNLYIRSRRNRNIALVFSLAGAAGSIYSLTSGNRNSLRTLFWVSLGTGVVSTALGTRANTQLNQAVWLRNRDAMILLENQP